MSFLRVAPSSIVVLATAAVSVWAASSVVSAKGGLCPFCAMQRSAPSPDLLAVKSVYILPMRSGFDQYLANELARSGSMRVVTDPAHADAVITDHLGESFQQRMDDLFPAPAKASPKPAPKSDDSKADGKENTASADELMSSSRPVSSGINGRGNVFLVGRADRAVLWSDFRNPRSRQPKDMKRAADLVASDLKRALRPPDSGSK